MRLSVLHGAGMAISVVPPGCEAEALRDLPVHVLNPSAEHAETFHAWGIRTCGQLAALAETDLIARIGQAGKRLHLLARGAWPHLMFPMEPSFEESLSERMELDFPVEMLEPLLFLLSRMTDTLLERVKSKALAIAMLRVVLHLDGGKQHERIVRPALPLQDKPTLLKLLQLDLETHPPNAAILRLELHAQSAAPYRAQHGLFLPQAPEPGRLEVCWRVCGNSWERNVSARVELKDDHRPNAFRMVPFAPPPPKKSETVFAVGRLRRCASAVHRRRSASHLWTMRRCESFGTDSDMSSVRLRGRGASAGSGGRRPTGAAKSGMCGWRRRLRSGSAASPSILAPAAGMCRGRMTEYVELHAALPSSFLEGASLCRSS